MCVRLRQCANALDVPFYYTHILWLYFFSVRLSRFHDDETEKQRQKCHCVCVSDKRNKIRRKKCVISFWCMAFVRALACVCVRLQKCETAWKTMRTAHTQYGFQTTGRFFIDDHPYSLVLFDLSGSMLLLLSPSSIVFQLPSSIFGILCGKRDGDRIHWSYEW